MYSFKRLLHDCSQVLYEAGDVMDTSRGHELPLSSNAVLFWVIMGQKSQGVNFTSAFSHMAFSAKSVTGSFLIAFLSQK